MENAHNFGFEQDDTCNRNGCKGLIEERERAGCSCHINPPCASCTEPRAYCDECEWDEQDDHKQVINGYKVSIDSKTNNFNSWKPRELDNTRIDYRIVGHTHMTQKCIGVYPEGTLKSDIVEKVKGSFGGRFQQFGGGKFTYIAYTD